MQVNGRRLLRQGCEQAASRATQTDFALKCDFEITLTFDSFQVEAPGSDVGVGLGMYMHVVNGPNVMLSRVLFPEKDKHALRSNHWHGKKEDFGVTVCPDTVGRLRFERVGTILSYLWAPGTDGDEFKKVFECELGTGDIEFVRLNVYTGGVARNVEVHLLDLRVRVPKNSTAIIDATKIRPKGKSQAPVINSDKEFVFDSNQTAITAPKKMPTASPTTGAIPKPSHQTNESPGSGGGLGLVLFIGLIITLTVGLCLWFYLRRRLLSELADTSVAPPKPSQENAPTPTTLQCSICKKKLKVKAALAGKKVKCPQCGSAMLVP